jgi:hypothetical protein
MAIDPTALQFADAETEVVERFLFVVASIAFSFYIFAEMIEAENPYK